MQNCERIRIEGDEIYRGSRLVLDSGKRDGIMYIYGGKWLSKQIPAGTEQALLDHQAIIDPRLWHLINRLDSSDFNLGFSPIDENFIRSEWDVVGRRNEVWRGFSFAMQSSKIGKEFCGDVFGVFPEYGVDYLIDGVTPAPIGDSHEQLDPKILDGYPADFFAAQSIHNLLYKILQNNEGGFTPRSLRSQLKKGIVSMARDKKKKLGLPAGAWGNKSSCPRATMTISMTPFSEREPGWSMQVGDIPEYGVTVDGEVHDLTHPDAAIYSNFGANHHDREYGVLSRLAKRKKIQFAHERRHLQHRYGIKVGGLKNQLCVVPITDDPDLFDEMWPITKDGMRVTPIDAKYVLRLKYSDGFAEDPETALFLALLNNEGLVSYRYGVSYTLNEIIGLRQGDYGLTSRLPRITRNLSRYLAENIPHRYERKKSGADDDMSFVMHSVYVRDFSHTKYDQSYYDPDALLRLWMKAQTKVANDLERSKLIPNRAEYEDRVADDIFEEIMRFINTELAMPSHAITDDEALMLNSYVWQMMAEAQELQEAERVAQRG